MAPGIQGDGAPGGGEGLQQEMCDLDHRNHNNNTLLGLLTTLSGRRCSRGIQVVLGLT